MNVSLMYICTAIPNYLNYKINVNKDQKPREQRLWKQVTDGVWESLKNENKNVF